MVIYNAIDLNWRGENVGVGRGSSCSTSRNPGANTSATKTTATPTATAATTTTSTCRSCKFPQQCGRTCLQQHHRQHDNPPLIILSPPEENQKQSPSNPPKCSATFLNSPLATTHTQSNKSKLPFNPATVHSLQRPRPRKYRTTGPLIKVPQLPRLSENVRKLSPELRQILRESLGRLKQQQPPAEQNLSKDNNSLSSSFETTTNDKKNTDSGDSKAVTEILQQGKEQNNTPDPINVVYQEAQRRSSLLKTRANSVTSDYFSDSGEPNLGIPSLIQDHEFIIHFDDVDDYLSSRTTSRAASRSSNFHCDSSRASPVSELSLETESGKSRFLWLSDTESGRFLLNAPERENRFSSEKLDGKLKRTASKAKLSAKKDFINLVPETRLSNVKSRRGSSSSTNSTACTPPSLQHSHFQSTTIKQVFSSNLESPPLSLSPHSFEFSRSFSQLGAKFCRGSDPAAPWHHSNKSQQALTHTVDDIRIATMDHEKGYLTAGGLGPLSFSLSSLSGSSSPALESLSPARTPADLHTNSLNRRKSKRSSERDAARRSWGPADKEEGNKDFWASIQEPYDYIMGSNLIPDSCQAICKMDTIFQVGESNEAPSSGEFELSWDSGDVSPPYIWSFSEFLDQYNELYEWLIQVQLKLYSHSNPPDKAAKMAQQEELRRRTYRRKLFVEQGERVAQRYPSSAEEISWRVNYLNNKWDQLQSSFTPAKGRNQEVEVELDLAHEEAILKRWLSDMEEQIQPITCRLRRGCSLLTLQDHYKDNQILLKDIEAHGPVLKSVLRQYERIAAATVASNQAQEPTSEDLPTSKPKAPLEDASETNATNTTTSSSSLEPSTTKTSNPNSNTTGTTSSATNSSGAHRNSTKESSNIPRKARSLEKRWHQIYLRSLEWHYYLEGVIANFKEQGSSPSSESEDEPVSKCRRLSASSVSCGSSCGPSCEGRGPGSGFSCGSACSSTCSSPCPGARPYSRPRRWSHYDSNLSEAGSYIETTTNSTTKHSSCAVAVPPGARAHKAKDDYVCVNGTDCDVAVLVSEAAIHSPPEPMLVDPDQQQQETTTTAPQDCEASGLVPDTSAQENQDQDMVGSAGLDIVRARCGHLAPADILAEVNMIQDPSKTITTSSTNSSSSHSLMENENQVNGNTVSPTVTEDSGINLTPTLAEVSVNTELSGVRDSPSKSSCTNVERPSPNCAIFDFKHQDTDTEEAATNTTTCTATAACQANLNLVDCDPSRNRVYQVRRRTSCIRRTTARTKLEFSGDEEVDHEALQKIIDSAILDPDWLNSNIPSDIEFSGTEDEVTAHEHMDTGSDGGGTPGQSQNELVLEQKQDQKQVNSEGEKMDVRDQEPRRSISKESITKLVSDAEKLVREPAETGEEPPPIISPRPHLQLPLNGTTDKCVVVSSKQARVRQWLASQRRETRLSASCVLDSCDASGELTTGESDIESATSEDMDASTATQHGTSTRGSFKGSLKGSQKGSLKGSRDPLPSTDNTPTTERIIVMPDGGQSKVVMRSRKRRSGEQRPWSVSELYQLATRLDLAPFSVSETALHHLLTATPETPTNDNQAFGLGTPEAVTTSNTSPAEDATPTSTNLLNISSTSSTTNTISTTIVTSTGRQSPPTASNTGSLRRRKTRARRKSNLSLGRRTDSGSECLTLNLSGGSDNNQVSPSRRLSKSHSSGSDSASHCRRHIVKSSSFSGGCRAGSGGVSSSTEKCVSDCGGVLGVPRSPAHHARGDPCYSSDDSRPASPVAVIRETVATRSPAHTARSITQMSDLDPQNGHEDMSSLSEQAWDPYQEYKYLSEPYSEDIDQEAARKLLDFGDDYRKYIDSEGDSSFSGVPYRGRRSPHHRRLRSLAPPGPRDLDSDSDLDDLHHVIDESKSQLTVSENVLKKYSNEASLGLDYAELVATAQTNIKCLKEIIRHLHMEGTLEPELQEAECWGSTCEESPAPVDPSTCPPLPSGGRGTKKVPKVTKQLRETQGIVQRWEVLQAQAVERQRQSSQVRELQRQVKNLRLTLENLAEQASDASHTESLGTPKDLGHKLQEAKALLEEVKARKSEVSSLNLAVHRFFTDSGYSLAQLKDEVNDLYILYDEAHRRASTEVSRLEGLEATWKLWEAEAQELTRALRQDGDTLKVLDAAIQTGSLTDSVTASMQDVAKLLNERCKSQQPGKKLMLQHTRTQGVDIQGSTLSLGTSGDDCLSDSGTSGYESCSSEELSERERRLAHLRRLARDLEASLSPDSQAWLAITKTLSNAEMELKGLQKHCRDLVVRSTETLDQTKTSPQLRRRSWVKDSKVSRMGRGDRRVSSRDSNRGYGRRGWVWRVVRAALPFQAALLLLFCVACLLEPNCCDTHNSLTMTLTPQLRYVHGPPPV
ncbi:klarsicht protein [Palaemon carinicauda]|uniref:klarsicht protein n=1 Tax=Palaemon carinicauda TaxID=392227 RepID=UPI0035B68B1C